MLSGKYPDADPKRRYTVKETSALLGMHRNTLRKYTEAGCLTPVLHVAGRRVYYLGADINAFWNKTITP